MKDWYLNWFGEEYLRLYSHRDDAEAVKQVRFLCSVVPYQDCFNVLDIACGRGRHVTEWAKKGVSVVGIDRSEEALAKAKEFLATEQLSGFLVKADMRNLPFRAASFDLLTSMFTSFGYFETDDEHLQLLKHWRTVLKEQGNVVIDYLNRNYVMANLEPSSVDQRDGRIIEQKRVLEDSGRRVQKSIHIQVEKTGQVMEVQESVRMYSVKEMKQLLGDAGFHTIATYGDFNGSVFSDDSERLILTAKAK